jgi:hypothetical protein
MTEWETGASHRTSPLVGNISKLRSLNSSSPSFVIVVDSSTLLVRLWKWSTPLMSNVTCELFSWLRGSNVVTDKWIFTHKFLFDGTFDHYMVCSVLRGFIQHLRVDYDETFSLAAKPTTVHMVLAFAASRNRPI